MSKAAFSLRRISEIDLALCVRCNRASRYRAMRATFRLLSRVGDGVVWYALMALLPLAYGRTAWLVVLQMLIGGAVGLVLYKCLKRKTLRVRPFHAHSTIVAAAAPLDRFSFPSGHTLHAFSMSLIVSHSFSELAPALLGLAILIGASRPILGLHYPSDVLAGAAIGTVVAGAVISFPW